MKRLAAAAITAALVFNTSVFADTSEAVKYLADNNILQGYTDGSMGLDKNITRAEFAKMICMQTAAKEDTVKSTAVEFTDTNGHWAEKYIQRAAQNGWINGFEDKTFRPDENILYEQAVTIIVKAFQGAEESYKYPQDYIMYALSLDFLEGVKSVSGEMITRADAANLIYNAAVRNAGYSSSGDAGRTPQGGIASGGGASLSEEISVPSSGGAGGGSSAQNNSGGAHYPYIYYNPFVSSEGYSQNEENGFKDVMTSPLSTFSIDTDTASYSNMRRFLMQGIKPQKGSIRSEELINYFDYNIDAPENGDKFNVVTETAECPWNEDNKLVMVNVKAEEKDAEDREGSNLVFLIDVSGSMASYNKLPLLKKSLKMLTEQMDERDSISIVTYASGTSVLLESVNGSDKEKINTVIDGLIAYGGTNGKKGLELAYEQAQNGFDIEKNNRIILCTDGDFNIGMTDNDELKEYITEKRDKGIFISILGFGMGNYKDDKMEIIADNGDGGYYYIDTLKEARKVLCFDMMKTMYTVAKDVKLQVEFNPEFVKEYRLIGYENRLLNNEEFTNDKKDAGDTGAGAVVTALYEIVPSNGEVHSDLRYQNVSGTGKDELMYIKIRYKEPLEDKSIEKTYPVFTDTAENTSDNFRLAAACAEVGMLLNDSEYKGSASYDTAFKLARSAVGDNDYLGLRCEFVQLIDLMKYIDLF